MGSASESMALWVEQLRAGDQEAASRIWQEYFPALVLIARDKLRVTSRRAADEEDVALSALESFYRAAQNDRFPDLSDSTNLWRILSEMTRRKAVDLIRRNRRLKAGDDKVRGDSAFFDYSKSGARMVREPEGSDPTPELAAMLTEDCRKLLDQLADPILERIALAKLDGYTNKEIARQIHCTERTIERRIQLIKIKWDHES